MPLRLLPLKLVNSYKLMIFLQVIAFDLDYLFDVCLELRVWVVCTEY
jgi:hypothetical protein